MLPPETLARAAAVLEQLRARGGRVATAESCTGGLLAAALTHAAGASAIFDWGVVTYSNEAKTALLGVDPALLAASGAVSEPVARAMAKGARARSGVTLAVSVTGIAGPDGGSAEKPVGLVWFGLADAGRTVAVRHHFAGDRAGIRAAAVAAALDLLLTTT